ncbi:hypothetical protein BKA66DRAFT_455162 [Pyrenochaeta sp. MPI-SDFR-AT-0127]|nr:hypothetical protein BKA66DRAFT_455162 [Pyrenochaeta sp. MPI-SDFR-AT-0127]
MLLARFTRLLHLRSPTRERKYAQAVEEHQTHPFNKASRSVEAGNTEYSAMVVKLHGRPQQETGLHNNGMNIKSLPIETLQNIFSYLDLRTLLKCRSVCKLWVACIPGNSAQLREALFLSSTITKPCHALSLVLNFVIHCNSTKKSKGYIAHVEGISFSSLFAKEGDVLLNPFIRDIERYAGSRLPNLNHRYQLRRFRFVGLKDKSGRLWHPSTIKCVRDTFVTIPPVTCLQIRFVYENQGVRLPSREGEKYIELQDETGVNFMEVFDIFEQQVAGLLKHETIRRIEKQPKYDTCSELHHLREQLLLYVSPL